MQLEFRPNDRRNQASLWWAKHRNKVTSQNGEDGVILKIFEIIGARNKWCMEFGAWDGVHFSNTYNLIKNLGWTGVLVEANSSRCRQIHENLAGCSISVINKFVGFTDENSIDCYLGQTECPEDIDFISIDIDGCDYHVWDSMTRFRPRVVLIEFNPSIPNDVYFVQDRDMTVNQASSLLAINELARSKGYQLVAVLNNDAFFVLEEEYEKFNIPDNSIDAMFNPARREMRAFFTFDGTLYVAGRRQVGWGINKNCTFEADELQIIPKEKRIFKP